MDGHVGGFTIEESARRLGHYRWASIRLFEVLGSWVASVPEPNVKVFLAAASRHHGWHADLLRERLPEVRELHPDRQTVPADARLVELFDELESLRGPDVTAERLTGVYGVVIPHLIEVQSWHLDRCTDVADASVMRTLGFVLRDEVGDVEAGRRLLEQLGSGMDSAARAAAFRSTIEELLSTAGGISGPGTLVDTREISGRSSSAPDDVDVPG